MPTQVIETIKQKHLSLFSISNHLKRACKASLWVLNPVGRQIVKRKPRRQSNDLRVPISALAHPDLDADDVDPIDATRVFGRDADATHLWTELQLEGMAPFGFPIGVKAGS